MWCIGSSIFVQLYGQAQKERKQVQGRSCALLQGKDVIVELAERQRCGCCEGNAADVRGAEGVLRGSSWDTRVHRLTSMSKSSSEGKRLCRDRSLPLRGSVARPPECAGGSIAQ